MVCYTDDMVLLSTSKAELQILLDYVSEKLSEICLRLNVDKCCYIVFRKNESAYNTAPVRLCGQLVNRVSECKYLGVVLSDSLCVKKDVDRTTSTFLKRFNSVY